MFTCKFCGREFEKGTSLGGHTSVCSMNPNSNNKKKFSEGCKIIDIHYLKCFNKNEVKKIINAVVASSVF